MEKVREGGREGGEREREKSQFVIAILIFSCKRFQRFFDKKLLETCFPKK